MNASNGSGQTNITNNNWANHDPSWSPDGTRIAFQALSLSGQDVYIMSADGTGQTNITQQSAADGLPDWGP